MTEKTLSGSQRWRFEIITSRRKFLAGAGFLSSGALAACAPRTAQAPPPAPPPPAPGAPAPPPTAAPAPPPPPPPGQKVPKEVAMYQYHPNGEQHCGICAHFMPPNSCEIVLGPIDPNGWCRYFKARG